MASVEKREDGWYAEGSGPFTSRDAARDAIRKINQEDAMATYDENVAASEALDGAVDDEATALVEHVAQEFPEAESFTGGFDVEVQELADGSVTRETAKEVRKRENLVYMALYANTAPARAYWRKLAESEGYEVPADVTDATV
jgi:hypothetical protein